MFSERINTEFVRVVDPRTIRMRIWERSNGETMSCGSGACAAARMAVELGHCEKGKDITVEFPGGDVLVNCTDEKITLTAEVSFAFEGKFEY